MPVVIKLKGMPWEATSRDIKDFFRDSKISEHDIHLAPNEDGKACGVGFACFFDDEDARRAMQRNGAYLGKRYVELFLSSQAEMEKALRDGVALSSAEVRPRQDGRPSRGERSEKSARERSRSPRDRASSKISRRSDSSHGRRSQSSSDFRSNSESSFVKPRNDKERDDDFRRGGLSYRGRGHSRGESTRGFGRGGTRGGSRGGSRGGMRGGFRGGIRGSGFRGGHSSFSGSRSHFSSDDRSPRGQQFRPKGESNRGSFFTSQSSRPSFQSKLQPVGPAASQGLFLKLSGMPYTAVAADIMSFFKGIHITAVHIIPNKSGPFAGRSSGSAFVECATQADCLKALQKHGEYLGKRYLNVVRCTLEEIVSTLDIDINLLSGQFPMEFGAGSLDVPRNQGMSNFPTNSLSSLSGSGPSAAEKTINLVAASANINLGDIKDGCVVGLRNLPTKINPEDILHFFRGYPAIPDSVRIHYLDSNRCSGDAMVTLVSNEEARSAIRQLSGKQLGGRKVELFLL